MYTGTMINSLMEKVEYTLQVNDQIRVRLDRCAYEDQVAQCSRRATVFCLEDEHGYCLIHFRKVTQ